MSDAPDWHHVVVAVAYTGEVTDAPDWERVVVGPGGTPLTPGISTTSSYAALVSSVTLTPTPQTLLTVTAAVNGLYLVLGTMVCYTGGGGDTGIMNVNIGTAVATANAIQSAATADGGTYLNCSGFMLMEVTTPGTIVMQGFTTNVHGTKALGTTGGDLPGSQTTLGLIGPL